MVEDRPNWRAGKLCYIEIPAADLAASGGQIVDLHAPAAGETFARFRDPAGNVLGLYQQHGLAQMEQEAEHA